PEHAPIPELELIHEEDIVLREESASIARGMYPGKPQPISQAPSNVYVVTDEEIRHSGAIDLPTILRRIPGIDVMQTTGADFNVAARGDNQLRANKMLVLVDGRSIFLDFQGEVLWKNIPVTLPEIKRIEVLKGPAAALYGFNAFDGVINIITKSAAEMKGVTVQFGGGEFGTISSAAIVAGIINKFGYRLSYGHNQTNQWSNRDGLAFRNNLMNGQLEYAMPGDAKLTLQGGLTDSNRYDGPVVDNVINQQKPNQRYVNAVYDRPNFFIRGYWTGTNQPATLLVNPALAPFLQLTGKDGTANNTTDANSYNIEMQHSVNFWAENRLTYGVNYRHNAISGNFLDGYSRENRLGLYLQDEWRLTDTLTAVGGLRYDLDTFISPTVSPRFSLQYSPSDNHSFRAGVSVGYRPPTLFERHTLTNGLASFTLPFPPITIQTPTLLTGSSNLAPEQIISYDAGYQGWYWKHRVRVRTDVFFNHISDLISIVNTGTNTLSFANGGNQGAAGQGGGAADIYGFEVGAEAQLTTWLTAFFNYTFQEIGQTYNSTNRVARGAPKHKVNAGAHAEFENGLSGDALLFYVSSATYPIDPSFVSIAGPPFNGPPAPDGKVPSYALLNLRGAYKIWREKKTGREAEVAVSAFNALNDHHKEHPLGEMLASRVMGWLTVRY
ncbi:MAG: TonB-dependent receptor, partial [Nitrospira sp.]|nr:TonB-dependent receptor [Nitrospira sp.]